PKLLITSRITCGSEVQIEVAGNEVAVEVAAPEVRSAFPTFPTHSQGECWLRPDRLQTVLFVDFVNFCKETTTVFRINHLRWQPPQEVPDLSDERPNQP